jgi:diguanylate cyclase (GGDEF)-like protein/PAS domain S-box-containing protein
MELADGNLLVRSIRYSIERKRAVEALQNSEARFRRLSESGIIGIAYFDADGRITDGNDKFLAMVGSNRGELSAGRVRRWGRLVPPEWRTRMLEASEQFSATGRITPYETEYLSRDGSRFWGLFGAAKLEGQPDGIAFIVDITERKRLEEEITHMAHHDVLTGLPNRRLFMELILFEIAEARRNRTKTGLLLLDLDRFKEVNDTLGHEAGDKLLKTVAERLRAAIRDSDAVARFGGDEFTILLAASPSGVTSDALISWILRERCPRRPRITIDQHGHQRYPDDGDSIESLAQYADTPVSHRPGRERSISTIRTSTGVHRALKFENTIRRNLVRRHRDS